MSAVDEQILEHYRQVAEKYGESSRSTMEDDYVREKELEWITRYHNFLAQRAQRPLNVLDLGCGNGFALARLLANGSQDRFWGVDFSEELLTIARQRNLRGCELTKGDARNLKFDSDFFDFVYTERCLINIMDRDEQHTALREIARVLKPGGDYLMIECFSDGLANNNKARADCGLPAVKEAHHNLYFDKADVDAEISGIFRRVDANEYAPECPLTSNFLSSYYFISRVLYPALLKKPEEFVRNSEVAKFFSFLPPIGNYSQIEAMVLRKI